MKKNAWRMWALVLLLPLFGNCDILRLSPFEITRWGPGEGRFDDPPALSIFLEFSHMPGRTSVEKNFSLMKDGVKVKGRILWEGRKLMFVPLMPMEMNHDYSVELSAEAHDNRGLSMDSAFEGRFSTRPDDTRPCLISIFPDANSVIEDSRLNVRLIFSCGIPLNSLRDHVSFSPSMNGIWQYEDGQAVFTPLDSWAFGKQYEIKISASLQGNNGRSIGRDHTSVFSVGADTVKPFLYAALRVSSGGQETQLRGEDFTTFYENSGWEKSDKLRLVFSEPVDALSVKSCINADGIAAPLMKTAPGFTGEIIFAFEKAPAYDSRFSLTLKGGIKDSYGNVSEDTYLFKIHANGAYSKPPGLAGIRIPMAPGNKEDPEPVVYAMDSLFADFPVIDGIENYPFTLETNTWIECYFDIAPGNLINLFSLMELFRISTSNNVITFSPRSVITDDFSLAEPQPGWEQFYRAEIRGTLINTVNSGIVYIEIQAGLTDTGGNRNENAMRISLLK